MNVQNLPIGIVVQRLDLNFDRRLVAVRCHAAKTPLTVTGRSQLRVMIGRPVSMTNAATRTNSHMQKHGQYP